jgi:hypothetical protein
LNAQPRTRAEDFAAAVGLLVAVGGGGIRLFSGSTVIGPTSRIIASNRR